MNPLSSDLATLRDENEIDVFVQSESESKAFEIAQEIAEMRAEETIARQLEREALVKNNPWLFSEEELDATRRK